MPAISPDEERYILIQLRTGNEQAFEEIYRLYSARLYSNLLKLVKSDFEAQDILQDVFLKVWNNRANIDINQSFRSYLFKIAENKVYDFFRKAVKDKKQAAYLSSLASSEYLHLEELLTNERMGVLQKAIDSLPQQRRQVFRLCKIEGKSYKEVSEMLGISVSTISDHIVKATKSIRHFFNDNELALNMILLPLLFANL